MKLIKLILLLFPGFLLSQNIELSESIKRGKLLYQDFCVRCHLPNGKGLKGIFPPLAKSDYLFKNMEESIKALKFGGIDGYPMPRSSSTISSRASSSLAALRALNSTRQPAIAR